MMRLACALLAIALGLGLAACATVPGSADPAAARMRVDPASLILLTVANPAGSVAAHAGSSLRGYDSIPLYTSGDRAHAAVVAIEQDYGLREVAAWPIMPLRVHCVVLEVPSGALREEVLSRLSRDPRVGLAQPMQTFGTLSSAYNDPYFGLQRGFAQIDAADAQQWSRGDGVRVAVIDTGMDSAHPDLQGRVETQRNFVDDDSRQFDADRHGTEVAGIIAAAANNREGIVGIAPGVHIFALKACWEVQPHADGAQCNSFTLAQALTVAIESGARVINLSLGGPADPLLAQLVSYALKRGIVVIGAVPPDGRVDGFPVGVSGVIAVDAIERSSASTAVLHAPGREVLTLTPGGHYDFVSGSSLAAAHVTGAVALLLAMNPHLDASSVYSLLSRTSVADSGGITAINVCAAAALLRPEGGCGTVRSANADVRGATAH
ncbi:S8 family peptidase [Nevskia soli]|uniref:S8 family peptidase n=1 Tax=Nevskia soli TaxID=418856 RepID=UPI0005680C8C|nr:S8 family serine peptidase [Nevskia soli]